MSDQVFTRAAASRTIVPNGETAVLLTFIAIPTIWASLIAPLLASAVTGLISPYIAGAALVGVAAGALR